MWFDLRFGQKFIYYIYMPQFIFVTVLYIFTPVWRRLDERYHLRFSSDEIDQVEENEQFVTWSMRKKPMTRKRFSEVKKVVYHEEEEFDYIPEQPLRYR